ncbi:uncharacterized protein MAM_00475 [Metarhizium album ARSEF 1941]|uniref:PH domain-containing protein n=1 Tax=Metarhizium album (strain ARSEF 1941) TaxID=1081103 RepID=A0A0B2X521_METAS|nr:uncharacterized protein MAM_00475 [Metarhizium album ARSEF 1941]KHO01474.1 hypothetical protein MAM_00475 [Metarhizium album ARSEF 1941]
MAHDAMGMQLGPIEAVPVPPTQTYSRYRSLRGKSVSSPRDFGVFQDDAVPPSDSNYSGLGQSNSLNSLRGRSKSVSTHDNATAGSKEPLPLPAMPPAPGGILSPRSINISAPSGRKILENIKSPIFSAGLGPWKPFSKISKSANKDAGGGSGTDGGDCKAAAGPRAQKQAEPDHQQEGKESQEASGREGDEGHRDGQSSDSRGDLARQQKLERPGEPAVEDAPNEAGHDTRGRASDVQRRQQGDRDTDNQANHLVDEVARLEAETDRILAEQRKLDVARLQAHQLVTPPPKPKRQLLDKLIFFSRSKRSAGGSQPATPSTVVSAIFSSPATSHSSRDDSIATEEPAATPGLPAPKMGFIEPGGKGIVPQTDAPVSASNGGERRITVRCLSTTVSLPVTADTSPVDILKATADRTTHDISPATCVIMECYSALGLERRLRRYERVRDVMNSWDRDQQHSLLVVKCESPNSDRDLDLEAVPRTEQPPQGFSMQMHYSSKPGKWIQRWVTLLENGQIYAAKSPNAKATDKDSTVLCHMTDFDIYSPKESQTRRALRPPHKFCYAIKSQQKTVVFANADNFVHYFSTDDARQAGRFSEKVHAWRSWYLVNRIVDPQKKRVPQIESPNRSFKCGNSSARASTISSKGDDEPLMNVNAFRMSQIVITPEETSTGRSASVKSKPSLHSSGPVRKNGPAGVELSNKAEPEFAAGGLLGSAYDKLKQSDAASATSGAASDGPFTEAPSLLNGGISNSSSDASDKLKKQARAERKKVEVASWFPSAAEHSARIRSQSLHAQSSPYQQRRPIAADIRPMVPIIRRSEKHPAPLLSFSKDYPEPPRFREGPTSVRQLPGQPLISYATGGSPREARDGAPRNRVSRRGLPASNGIGFTGPPSPSPQLPSLPPGSLGRSKTSSSSTKRFGPVDTHPHHPMPAASGRRRPHGEPLVNRAK